MGLADWLENRNSEFRKELRREARQEGRLAHDVTVQEWYQHEKANGNKFDTPPPRPDDPKE